MKPLEQELGGELPGLYGEVVTMGTYRLNSVQFQPDVVFDIGANVGIFSRFARTLFPSALIVAVESHPDNCRVFKEHTNDSRIVLIECALGSGTSLFHGTTARNGSGETYLSAGLGYPLELMEDAASKRAGLELSPVSSVSLPLLFDSYVGDLVLMKIDCEGAENCIWDDEEAMDVLRNVDYLAMEIHTYAHNGKELDRVREAERTALRSLEDTHVCARDGVHFWATKRV